MGESTHRVTMSALAVCTAMLRGSWPCSSASVCDAPRFRNRHTWLWKAKEFGQMKSHVCWRTEKRSSEVRKKQLFHTLFFNCKLLFICCWRNNLGLINWSLLIDPSSCFFFFWEQSITYSINHQPFILILLQPAITALVTEQGQQADDLCQVFLTLCVPGRWHDAVDPCLSCPSGSHRRRSAAGTHRLWGIPERHRRSRRRENTKEVVTAATSKTGIYTENNFSMQRQQIWTKREAN